MGFLGIPFGKPPVGRLRFAVPESAGPWNGVLNATEHPPGCLQMSRSEIFSQPARGFDEDCLYLNVFTSVSGTTGGSWGQGGHGGKGAREAEGALRDRVQRQWRI